MNDVDRVITTSSLQIVKAGIANMAIVAGKYPDVITRLSEVAELVKEIEAFANDEERPSLIPRNQNAKMN